MDSPGHPHAVADHSPTPSQLTLEETAVDACSRKRHAVERGYFEDPYLRHFTRDATYLNSPLMNRGYWLRVRTVESAINRFVQQLPENSPFQVVSLGGGYDSLFFRWAGLATGADPEAAAQAPAAADAPGTDYEAKEFALSAGSVAGQALRAGRLHRFVEIDQREVVEGKRRIIQRHSDVAALAGLRAGCPVTGPLKAAADPTAADVFRLVAADLRKVDELCAALTATGGDAKHEVPVFTKPTGSAILDASIPTIVIAECVLVYMRAEESLGLLQGLVNCFAKAPSFAVLSYDAIRPSTPFGKQMIHSLGARGLELRGIQDLPAPADHKKRYAEQLGFGAAAATWTMKELFVQVPQPVQKRLQHVEMLDDYDEWCLVQEHYCMSWAVRSSGASAATSGEDAPREAPPQQPPRLFF